MVTIIGDPDGVPESGVRPGVEPGNAVRELEIGGTVHFTLPDAPAGAFVVTDVDERSVTMTWHGKPDPAALLGPVREPVDWNPRDAALEWLAYLQGRGSLTDAERAREGKAWRALGYPERDVALVAAPGMPPDVLYDLRGATLVCEDDEPLGVYERNAAGDEEC